MRHFKRSTVARFVTQNYDDTAHNSGPTQRPTNDSTARGRALSSERWNVNDNALTNELRRRRRRQRTSTVGGRRSGTVEVTSFNQRVPRALALERRRQRKDDVMRLVGNTVRMCYSASIVELYNACWRSCDGEEESKLATRLAACRGSGVYESLTTKLFSSRKHQQKICWFGMVCSDISGSVGLLAAMTP